MIQNYRPKLVNSKGVPTEHVYTRSESVTLHARTDRQVTGTVHVFRCTVTGVERVFGFDASPWAGKCAA